MLSLKSRILILMEKVYSNNPDQWVHKGTLEDKAREIGYLADNCGRRCRELCNEGRLERHEVNGSVEYRFIPFEKRDES